MRTLDVWEYLEAQFYSHLDLPRTGSSIGTANFLCRVAKPEQVGCKTIRLIELDAVEQIIEFKAHIKFHVLTDPHLLRNHRIGVLNPRAAKMVAPQVAAAQDGFTIYGQVKVQLITSSPIGPPAPVLSSPPTRTIRFLS